MNRKSNVLAGLMLVVNFFSDLFKELKKRNVTEEKIFDALKSKNDLIPQMAEKIADLIAGVKKNILHIFSNIPLQDRITSGKYDWVNSDITEEHFHVNIPTDYDTEYKLYHFNRSILSEDAIKEMDKDGFRPAILPELLVLGETQPELQREFPIVALGSVWRRSRDNRDAPGLFRDGAERGLDLAWFGSGWVDRYRFLAVRK